MRLRIFGLLCFLLLGGACTNGQPAEDPATPAFTNVPELMAGFRLLYIQRYPQARTAFAAWESQHPDEPFGEVAVAASYLFEEFYYQGVLTSDFFLNMILRKKNLDALKRLKEANAHAKALLAQRPDAYDAYVALGSANYIIGSLSVGFRAMLWFGGVHGDKKLGMEQVAKTVENGRYLKPFAKIMLGLAACREKQNKLAQKLFHELSEEFPESQQYAIEHAKAMARTIPPSMHP